GRNFLTPRPARERARHDGRQRVGGGVGHAFHGADCTTVLTGVDKFSAFFAAPPRKAELRPMLGGGATWLDSVDKAQNATALFPLSFAPNAANPGDTLRRASRCQPGPRHSRRMTWRSRAQLRAPG